jgi:TetR/AcrR family acrAB operon transcriptional repressor
MRRAKEDTEKTRQELLRVAVKVFNDNGYARTRLEDVAAAAGVSRGAIYYHFGSKAEIFKTVVMENKDQMFTIINEIINDQSISKIQAIRSTFTEYLHRIEDDEYFRDVETLLYKTELAGDLKDVTATFSTIMRDIFTLIKRVVSGAVKEGSLKKDLDLDSFTFAIMSYHYGLMSLWITNRDLFSIKEKSQEFINIFLCANEVS